MVNKYIPDKGDVVWINLDPTSGHEQRGRRPALVLTSKSFNDKTGLAYVAPITQTDKKYPFRFKFENKEVGGFVMAEQLKSLDWVSRKAVFICKASEEIVSLSINSNKGILDS